MASPYEFLHTLHIFSKLMFVTFQLNLPGQLYWSGQQTDVISKIFPVSGFKTSGCQNQILQCRGKIRQSQQV